LTDSDEKKLILFPNTTVGLDLTENVIFASIPCEGLAQPMQLIFNFQEGSGPINLYASTEG
jgi:hypothetical protein